MQDEPHSDLSFVRLLLDGDETACREFLSSQIGALKAWLTARCRDDRSRIEAAEIVDALAADCFGGRAARGEADAPARPLLQLYNGRGPLLQWLRVIASNRLKTLWNSGRWRYESPEHTLARGNDDGAPAVMERSAAPGDADPWGEDDTIELLRASLLHGMGVCPPRGLVFMRLAWLHDVPQKRIAELWKVDPATITRTMQNAMRDIERETLDHLQRSDPGGGITSSDLHRVLAAHPRLVHGD